MLLRFLLPVILATTQHASANEWIVGPGGFADLQSAYAAAAPGDVIRIRLTSIPRFALQGKGVVIRGDGVLPIVQPFESSISGVPSGQTLVIENLSIDGGLELRDCAGAVVLLRVACWSPTAARVRAVTGLLIERCSLVHAYDSSFAASSALGSTTLAVGTGVDLLDSHAMFQNCRIEGCDGYAQLIATWPWPQYFTTPPAWPVSVIDSSVSLIACSTRDRLVYGHFGVRRNPGHVTSYARFAPVELILALASFWEIEGGTSGFTPPVLVRSFGTRPVLLQSGFDVRSEAEPLPRVDASWIEGGRTLSVQASNLAASEVHFLGFSFAPSYRFIPSLDFHGAVFIDLDRSRSALLDVIPLTAGPAWSQAYRLSQTWLDVLRDRPLYFQAFSLDAAGKLRCSMPAFLMR